VQFGYKGKAVLKGIDLDVKRGEVVAFVGASGAGKTTLVNLIPRFYDVAGGSIEIGGVDIRDMTLTELRSHIALVTQDVFLFNESIKENIMAGSEAGDLSRVHSAITAAHASDFVARMPKGIETIVGERGSQLSGGERQRISIARALFKNAPILILDEATSSLDSESEKIVQAALDDLMEGRTTFIIAHRLSTIQKADRIIVLSDGKIIEQGNHGELLKAQGAYHRLHLAGI
jgi:subfamily B ATP-binding cassette protein MsbA